MKSWANIAFPTNGFPINSWNLMNSCEFSEFVNWRKHSNDKSNHGFMQVTISIYAHVKH